MKNIVRAKMVEAMKAHDAERKQVLANLLNHLNMAEKDKLAELTQDESNAVVLKVIKQIKETIDSCPANRTDILDYANFELAVVSEFAPKQMDESEINTVIDGVFAELALDSPTAKDKGTIMKLLMPRVKGKADGKLVNELLMKRFA